MVADAVSERPQEAEEVAEPARTHSTAARQRKDYPWSMGYLAVARILIRHPQGDPSQLQRGQEIRTR